MTQVYCVGTMDTEHQTFAALGRDWDEMARAMADAFDSHLENNGDENRERFLAGLFGLDDSLPTTLTFGTDLDTFAAVLHEHYSFGWYALRMGEADRYGMPLPGRPEADSDYSGYDGREAFAAAQRVSS